MRDDLDLAPSVAARYAALVRTGEFDEDPAQLALVRKLDALRKRLDDNRLAQKRSPLGWLFGKREEKSEPVRGLYIWGGVGRGKTKLMDIFFELSPIKRKRRAHFHEFMGKPHQAIFHEFKGGSFHPDDVEGSGDVKYHLGASSDREFDGNNVHLSLTANPSHLEIVNPVVLGKARAKQDQHRDMERTSVLPLLLHGDAAFAGQGVVAECFGLSGLKGHKAGGSVHFIINNQIGFTTNPRFSRSSPYPSDMNRISHRLRKYSQN